MLKFLSYSRQCCLLATLLFANPGFAQTQHLQIVTESSPPYQIMQDGEVAGLATNKVRELVNRAGITANFSMYPWARAYKKALNEPNTLIYSMAKTDKREDLFYWLMPVTHYQFGFVRLTNRVDIQIDDIENIKHYRFAVQRDDISHEWLLNKGLIEGEHFITCSDINCSWQLLLNKNVDVIIETAELIPDMLKQYGKALETAVFIKAIPELAITGYLATNKNIDPLLLSKLKTAIAHQ